MTHVAKLIVLFFFICAQGFADAPNDADALEGISTGKVVWDVTIGNPKKLLIVMNVINETYQDLIKQQVTPDMVFTFRGGALRLMSSQPLDFTTEEAAAREELLKLIQSMHGKPGVKMESCSIASRLMGIDNSTLIPELKPVGNTFVSLIGYQQKGYALIPIN